jgi:hypothetical protein
MSPAAVNVPVAGSYNSADAVGPEGGTLPPAKRTLPSFKRVAV